MDRLTYWNNKEKGSALPTTINDNGDTVDLETLCVKLAAYEDTGLEPSEIPTGLELANVFAAMQELKRYKDAEGQGLLVRLPCKDGMPIWWVDVSIEPNERGKWTTRMRIKSRKFDYGVLDWIDTSIYLTREAAEAALAEVTDTAK